MLVRSPGPEVRAAVDASSADSFEGRDLHVRQKSAQRRSPSVDCERLAHHELTQLLLPPKDERPDVGTRNVIVFPPEAAVKEPESPSTLANECDGCLALLGKDRFERLPVPAH